MTKSDYLNLLEAIIGIPSGLLIGGYLCAKLSKWSRIVEARSKGIGANREAAAVRDNHC